MLTSVIFLNFINIYFINKIVKITNYLSNNKRSLNVAMTYILLFVS